MIHANSAQVPITEPPTDVFFVRDGLAKLTAHVRIGQREVEGGARQAQQPRGHSKTLEVQPFRQETRACVLAAQHVVGQREDILKISSCVLPPRMDIVRRTKQDVYSQYLVGSSR